MSAKYVISVCQGPDCTGNGSDALVPAAEKAIAQKGLAGRCRVKRGGCYGLCEQGANVIVRYDSGKPDDPFGADDYDLTGEPGETHYCEMTPEKIVRVIEEHVGKDAPIPELEGVPPWK